MQYIFHGSIRWWQPSSEGCQNSYQKWPAAEIHRTWSSRLSTQEHRLHDSSHCYTWILPLAIESMIFSPQRLWALNKRYYLYFAAFTVFLIICILELGFYYVSYYFIFVLLFLFMYDCFYYASSQYLWHCEYILRLCSL